MYGVELDLYLIGSTLIRSFAVKSTGTSSITRSSVLFGHKRKEKIERRLPAVFAEICLYQQRIIIVIAQINVQLRLTRQARKENIRLELKKRNKRLKECERFVSIVAWHIHQVVLNIVAMIIDLLPGGDMKDQIRHQSYANGVVKNLRHLVQIKLAVVLNTVKRYLIRDEELL